MLVKLIPPIQNGRISKPFRNHNGLEEAKSLDEGREFALGRQGAYGTGVGVGA